MGKKKVVLRPFHEVAFEILEKGVESEAFKLFQEWVGCGQDVVMAVAIILTQCIVPEKERSRIVPALIAASKKGAGDRDEVNTAVAFALTYFRPGKKGLKELGKELANAYLECKEDSDEERHLKNLLEKLKLEVPKRPEKEKSQAKKGGGKKKSKPKKPLTK